MIAALSIKVAKVGLPVASLSGGNQQKVVIGKWLMTAPRIILLNDPTRGIDVGTKQEIYALLRRLADAGAAIVFYSTDYAELIGCCDRVLVLYDGQVKRTLVGDEITEKALIASALNLDVGAAPSDGRRGARREGMALLARRESLHAGGVLDFHRDVLDLRRQPSRWFYSQCRADGGQQGRAARARGDGADDGGDHGRHRPLRRHDLRALQLPRLATSCRRRLAYRLSASSSCSRRGRPAARSTACW